jgi:hypothetical protein
MKPLRAVLSLLMLTWMLSSCNLGYESITLSRTDIEPIIRPDSAALKFHATIDLFRNHFSGILVAKQTDSLTAHLIFVSEIGMKIFDLELGKDSIHVAYAFPGLDSRPKAMELLKTDFGTIFLYGIYNHQAYVRMCFDRGYNLYWEQMGRQVEVFREEGWKGKQLTNIKKGNRWRKATRIQYRYEERKLSTVSFAHRGLFHLKIQLNALEKS